MSVILGDNKNPESKSSFTVKRMITCPGHWLVPPTVDVYLREPVELLKNCSDKIEFRGKILNIKKTRIVKDCFGNKVLDWKKLYRLRKEGIVLHPKVSAAWAIEHVYDPLSFLCAKCDKRCKEGTPKINILGIKRLNF